MKLAIISISCFATLSALAAPSPFLSSVKGITIGNTHEIAPGVLRGSEPSKKIKELSDFGIQTVLIFKNQTKTEVDDEAKLLSEFNIKSINIPFKWKELESTKIACEQIVKGLNVLKRAKKSGTPIFFHCTVGEDRTGLLAGLFRIENEGLSAKQAWKEEMCAKGYSDGNPNKPWTVTSAIHKELTPLYFALATKMESGEQLTIKSCESLVLKPVQMTCRK